MLLFSQNLFASHEKGHLDGAPHSSGYSFWENTNSAHDVSVPGVTPEVEVVAAPLQKDVPEPEETDEISPDSISWDPVKYMTVPFTVRTKDGMGWSPAEIDTRDLYFDQLHDVTDEVPTSMLNNVSNLLSLGDLSSAKSILEAHFGSEVEIVKA